MPQFAVEVHPLAADEAEAAERWYRERNDTAATRCRHELDRAVDLISERPEGGHPYVGATRRVLLRRFPFFVVYRVLGERVHIVAVAPCAAMARVLARALMEKHVVRKSKTDAQQRKPFRAARRRALARLRMGFDLNWTPARSRQELHDRDRRTRG
jgi:toxin ParE1/3/4